MTIKKMSKRAALMASAGFWVAFSGIAWAQDASPTEADDEVIVTAQKREQSLIEVPLSVTVLDGGNLELQQADTFLDYIGQVPGLSIEQATPGASRLILRGVNTGSIGSTLGIYVDETPFGSSTSLGNAAILAGDFDTFDLERVEVLRGPQGTLYGANSLGGVLKFVTQAPKLGVYEARAQIGAESVKGGDDFGYNANAVVNLPLGDTIAVRASGFYRENDGFIDATGRPAEDINGSESYGGRASALFEPTEALSVRLTGIYQKIAANTGTLFDADPLTLEPLANDPFTMAPLNGQLTFAQFFPDSSDVEYKLYNGTGDWDLGFASLTSATSYGVLQQDIVADASSILTGLVTFLYQTFGDPLTPPLGIFADQSIRQKKFTQELRLASPTSDTFEWLIGGYFTRETVALAQDALPFNLATLALTNPALLGFDDFQTAALDSKYKEYAGFANATWHILPRLDLSAGGRYSHNDQSSAQFLNGAIFLLSGVPAPIAITGESSENVFTWSVSPRFELSDNASIYARVAKGYRPGGPNVVPPGAAPDFPFEFDADTLISYEAGVKAQTADGVFAIDAAGYYLDWKDILVFAQFPSAVGPIGGNDNGPGAKSIGAEVTVSLRPVEGLSVVANGAYNDAELTADTSALVGGLDGDQLPFAPKWSGNISADYEWTLSGDATVFVGGNLRLVGDQSADFDRLTAPFAGLRLGLPSYEVVDLRTGVTFGNLSVTGYVRNLTDSGGLTSVGGFGGRPGTAVVASPIRPRTYGVTIGASF